VTRLDRSRYELEFDGSLEQNWLPFYLPQWSSREASAARVSFDPLVLRIDEDQEPWSPEYDGQLRVSNLQTGVRSGPVGSRSGQHPFRPDLVVHEQQPEKRLYTPQYGLIEATIAAVADPRCMVALWLVGFENEPTESGELCVFEIFGREPGLVGMGVHPFNDPALSDDFSRVQCEGDTFEQHTYSAEWLPGGVRFFVDDELVFSTRQSPAYPMQLMLNLYEFEAGGDYPKRWPVPSVRGHRAL
jgi:hypothetical protein